MGRIPWAVKWVLGPAAAVAVGFYGVAPRVGGKIPVPKIVRDAAGLVAPKAPAELTPKPEPSESQPSVRVAVRPVEEEAPKPTRRRRQRRHATEEARPLEAPAERTAPDPASTP